MKIDSTDSIIDTNINMPELIESTDSDKKPDEDKKDKKVNFRLSRMLESFLIWYSKKENLTDEQIEAEIKFDDPDKDLIDDALNPLISKLIGILGLEDNEIFALLMLVTVIVPRILFIMAQKKKENKTKEVEINEQKN